jgi:hypothetical protein
MKVPEIKIESNQDTITLFYEDFNGRMTEEFILLKEEKIRNELIKLGWTPKKECIAMTNKINDSNIDKFLLEFQRLCSSYDPDTIIAAKDVVNDIISHDLDYLSLNVDDPVMYKVSINESWKRGHFAGIQRFSEMIPIPFVFPLGKTLFTGCHSIAVKCCRRPTLDELSA